LRKERDMSGRYPNDSQPAGENEPWMVSVLIYAGPPPVEQLQGGIWLEWGQRDKYAYRALKAITLWFELDLHHRTDFQIAVRYLKQFMDWVKTEAERDGNKTD
jgi:hypothetical protein